MDNIALVLLIAAAAVMLAYGGYCYLVGGLLAPERRAAARVLLKIQRESMPMLDVMADALDDYPSSSGSGEIGPYHYCVRFAVDGRQQEFAVSRDVYASLHEGDEGLLVYKGRIFKYFLSQALRTEGITPPRTS